MRGFLVVLIIATIDLALVHSASRPASPNGVNLNEWSKLVEVPADHSPLEYPTYSQSRQKFPSTRPKSPPAKPVNLKEWSKLVEVPADHHPLEYPSLDSPIKDHERVHVLHFPSTKSNPNSPPGKMNGVVKSPKRKRVLDTGIVEARVPTRRAQLKAMIQAKTAKEEHYTELENIRMDSPENNVSGQEPVAQAFHPIQENSNTLGTQNPELNFKPSKNRKILDAQAKLKKKETDQRWYKKYMNNIKTDPEAMKAYKMKRKSMLYTNKAEKITNPVEKENYLRRVREVASYSRKRYAHRMKAKTGFVDKQSKRYHDSALAIKAGTATEEDIKRVQERRRRSREAYHKKKIRKNAE
ncbi:uncharacterized protein FA14DRAFT_173860 [Meira miltonrushii]|uniref:Uncharacterized protein n=1 Tax=Meira miltonrushii TaxID=1280837 RepID=A0A316V9I9_9BASI|nr:uncharacterized protein FA14DRAFT_173860 [Meira miltonrushii]PWN34156.1 hypothetical protein FA14DRAFT_173860 [Meira miltonrushii]